MARYCFYCGRELTTGEKCNCRTTGASYSQSASAGSTSSGASSQNSQSTSSRAGSQSGPSGSTKAKSREGGFKRFFQAFNPFSGSSTSRPKTNRYKSQAQWQSKTRQGFKKPQIDPMSVLTGLRQIGTYLFHPADSVRQAVQAGSRNSVLIILSLQGIIGGAFLLTATNQELLRTLLTLNVASASQGSNFWGGFFVFMQGFGISLAATLLLTLIYQIVLRYLYRQSIAFTRLLTSISPSCLYFTLFAFAGLLTLSASFFSAIMMLLAGFAIAALAQYLALRQISNFDENRSFILISFVLLIFTGILAMMLNLSLPVLKALLDQSVIV